MATTIIRQADAMLKDVDMLNGAAAQDVKVLEKRIADAKTQLQIVRSNSFNTGRNYRNHLENYIPKAEDMVREFVNLMVIIAVSLILNFSISKKIMGHCSELFG